MFSYVVEPFRTMRRSKELTGVDVTKTLEEQPRQLQENKWVGEEKKRGDIHMNLQINSKQIKWFGVLAVFLIQNDDIRFNCARGYKEYRETIIIDEFCSQKKKRVGYNLVNGKIVVRMSNSTNWLKITRAFNNLIDFDFVILWGVSRLLDQTRLVT